MHDTIEYTTKKSHYVGQLHYMIVFGN